MSNKVQIGVEARLDDASIAASASALSEKLNSVAKTVAQANKVKFTPVDKGTVEDLKKVNQQFNELLKISTALRDRIKATGQGGAGFGDLDWARLYEDPAIRARKMQQTYRHVTAGTAFGSSVGAPPPPKKNRGGGAGGGFAGVAAQVAGAGVRAAGPVGGVVADAAGSGMAGGLGAGVFGLLGGLAALAVGKGVSAVKEKVDAAGQEGIGYDTLKRTLGDVNVSFGLLRESLRAASYDISTTFEETQRLGMDFAKLSGISKEQYKTLAEEVSIGGGFGRSFGVDPSQSNQFFAQMRQFRVTGDAQDSRKLALMIGEAVARSGTTAKTEEMLSVIASFTASQARSGLSTPDVIKYSGLLSGLVGSGVPGLDPQGAAALLGRANSAIAGGGGAGEAGQNFLYRVLGGRFGLDPVQSMILQQQGAFGTGQMTFGKGSLYSKFASKFGAAGTGWAGTSRQSNLEAILAETQRMYAGNPSLMLNATARLLGINESQAMALHTIDPNKLVGMTGRMGRLGLDLSKLNGTGISALAQIESGTDLGAQANALLGNSKDPLSADQASRLRSAMASGDQDKLKDILTELTYTRGQEQTEGSKTRESIQNVEKRIQELATGLVGPMNDMRNAMVYLAGGGKKTAAQINKDMEQMEYDEKVSPLKAQRAKIDSAISAMTNVPGFGMANSRNSSAVDKLYADRKQIDDQIAAIDATRELNLSAELAKTDKMAGLSPGTAAAQMAKESGFNPNAYNARSGAMGMAQVMPKTLAALEKRLGRKLNPYSAKDAIIIQRELMIENKRRFGSDSAALAAYNSGWDTSKWGNAETTDYLATIERSRGNFATAIPDGAGGYSGGGSSTPKIMIEGTFNLAGPGGARAADPVTITKTVGAPQPQGR